jgi:membrane glycosyltransferase
MLPLDADSIMSGAAILRLVRVMQAYPKLGIIQSLTVGTPARSAFARLFQFGMRHSMRSYTMGSAWWMGDCGPYWGHNALIRIQPFRENCELMHLPGKPPLGGPILSHDQLEAVLMRRAGYEVRVAPVEGGSYEDNPPTLVEFAKRDVRWCLGNMQYLRCLFWPGLRFVSRVQIALAILMYVGSTAMTAAISLALIIAATGGFTTANPRVAIWVLSLIYLISLTPKLAGLADVALTERGASRYGGSARLVVGALAEILFSWMLSVIVTLRSTVFVASLIFGRSVAWGGQVRDAHRLNWVDAWEAFWPETLVGTALFTALACLVPALLPWTLPLIAALCLSAPFAVLTSSPAFNKLLSRRGICSIPEEIEASEILHRLDVSPFLRGREADPEESSATRVAKQEAVREMLPP